MTLPNDATTITLTHFTPAQIILSGEIVPGREIIKPITLKVKREGDGFVVQDYDVCEWGMWGKTLEEATQRFITEWLGLVDECEAYVAKMRQYVRRTEKGGK